MRAGQIVEVRDAAEILATLDKEGCLEDMPFMPEMFAHCGKQFRVSAVAHKTCDTAFKSGGRRLLNAVHLADLRCDGSAHGGCQATCLIFWKTAWLKIPGNASRAMSRQRAGGVDAARLQACTRAADAAPVEIRYRCQATQLFKATSPLPWWDFRQFVRDIVTGNATVSRAARVLIVAGARSLTTLGVGYRATSWFYDRIHRLLNGRPAPVGTGTIPNGSPTPTCDLSLEPGEAVRVLSHEQIKQTLNEGSKNRGMWFDPEMVKFCGKTYKVEGRVDRIINEVTGEMMHMKQPCVVLRGVACDAEYTDGRLLCRRAVTTYWREAWLERTSPGVSSTVGSQELRGPNRAESRDQPH